MRLILVLLIYSVNLWAQSHFKLEHITVNDGLAHSDAMSTQIAPNGFVWIGTNNGIDRYDGYKLKNYVLPNTNANGLYNNRISDLHISKAGLIYAAPEEQGVFYYSPIHDTFKSLASKTSNPDLQKLLTEISPRTLTTNTKGDLIIGTRTNGVLVLKFTTSGKIKNLTVIKFPYQKTNSFISKVFSVSENQTLIGTANLGLWKLEENNNRYTVRKIKEFTPLNANSIFFKNENEIWVSSSTKVAKLQVHKDTYTISWLKGSFANVNTIFKDSQSNLWLGTNFGLYRIHNLSTADSISYSSEVFGSVADKEHTINSNRIHQITEDSFKNLWIAASAGGLIKLNLLTKPFYHLYRDKSENNTLADNYINAITKDSEADYLWIGTRNGASRYHIKTKKYTHIFHNPKPSGLTNVSVSSIYDTKNGEVWLATRQNGIYKVNKETLQTQKIADVPSQRPWSEVEPLSIVEDNAGNLWIATFYNGLHVFSKEGKHIKSFQKSNSILPTDNLTFQLYDKENQCFWISTRNAGVFKIKEENGEISLLKHFHFEPKNPNSLKFNFTWPILKDKKNNIWIGTLGGGLHLIESKNGHDTIKPYDQWIPEKNVETLLQDNNGDIWIGGRGLYRLNPETKKYFHYDVADGLQSNSFKIGAATKAPNGEMYFGGINGISYFNPNEINSNPFPPKMIISKVRILTYESSLNQKENPRAVLNGPYENITFADNENDFSIEFVGLNFQNPNKQQYAYKLDGYHSNWISLPPGQRIAAFASLPAGNYTFLVKADNGDGLWTDEPAQLKITILPPWYKTWWAYLAYILMALFGLYAFQKNTLQKQNLKNKIALDAVEKEKQKELSELKLNFFTNISHELRTPLTLILSPSEELLEEVPAKSKEKITLINKQAKKLLELVNQLMDFRKIETGNIPLETQSADLVAFISEIFLLFKIKAEELQIRYVLDISSTSLWLKFDPSKVETIVTNLLSNAFKNTPKDGQINLSLAYKNNNAIIQVQDTGLGIESTDLQNIFEPFFQSLKTHATAKSGTGIGLALVKQMVGIHKGKISVKSEINKGACFTVEIPMETTSESKLIETSLQTHSIPSKDLTLSDSNFKLLIVEDNQEISDYLESIFKENFEIQTAPNGKIAYSLLQKYTPDLILSDVMMSEMDGLTLSKKVKDNPKIAHIPIVLITARAAVIHELEGLETGADDYIIKPFNPDILLSKVNNLLQNRKKIQEYFHKQILVEPSKAVLPDDDKEFIEKTMKIIETNFTNEDFNVQFLVKESNMSQSAFYRKLKNLTGQSVVEFIRDVRLKRAAQLLESEKYRVNEVMTMVGMEDYKYFRTSFMKIYKVAPSEYAKKQTKTSL